MRTQQSAAFMQHSTATTQEPEAEGLIVGSMGVGVTSRGVGITFGL